MKKKQRSIFTKIILPVVVIAAVIYLGISAWVGLRNSFPTTVAYTDVMEESVEATGWVVRYESPIPGGDGTGLVQLQRLQGEKVAKGETIGVVYQNEEYVENQEELLRTRDDLSALQFATYSESVSGAALEDQMLSAMTSLRTSASTGDFSNLSDKTRNYRKLVLRREFLVSSAAATEMGAAANELMTKYESLQNYQSGATTITAAAAGMYSAEVDGYETLLTPSILNGLSVSSLEEFSQMAPTTESNNLGKLITNPVWYYAVSIPKEYADRLSPKRTVQIYFNAISKTLNMIVDSVGEAEDGMCVVVLHSARDEQDAWKLRQEKCRFIIRSKEGLLIPKQALRVFQGETGVFVVNGYNARFRPVEIIEENEICYLVSPNPKDENDTRILRNGDEVILAAAELYDGKVVL